jgi:hypothetical protein
VPPPFPSCDTVRRVTCTEAVGRSSCGRRAHRSFPHSQAPHRKGLGRASWCLREARAEACTQVALAGALLLVRHFAPTTDWGRAQESHTHMAHRTRGTMRRQAALSLPLLFLLGIALFGVPVHGTAQLAFQAGNVQYTPPAGTFQLVACPSAPSLALCARQHPWLGARALTGFTPLLTPRPSVPSRARPLLCAVAVLKICITSYPVRPQRVAGRRARTSVRPVCVPVC